MTEPDRRKPTPAQLAADRRQSPLDKRLLLLLVLVVVVAAIGGGRLTATTNQLKKTQRELIATQAKIVQVERESSRNCELINAANVKFNGNLDASIGFTAGSTLLTEQEKAKRLAVLATFHLPTVHCPAV